MKLAMFSRDTQIHACIDVVLHHEEDKNKQFDY